MLAFAHDGLVEFVAEGFWKLIDLVIAVDLDGLLGGVTDNVAVVAPGKMVLQFNFGFFVEDAVQVTGQLGQEFRAFHWLPSPLEISPVLTSAFFSLSLALPFSRR